MAGARCNEIEIRQLPTQHQQEQNQQQQQPMSLANALVVLPFVREVLPDLGNGRGYEARTDYGENEDAILVALANEHLD